MNNKVLNSARIEEFNKTIRGLLKEFEETELFYKNNPHLKPPRVIDYISIVPTTPKDDDGRLAKLYEELRKEINDKDIFFITPIAETMNTIIGMKKQTY